MAVLPVCIYGDRVLRKPAAEVKEVTGELVALAEDMLETMYKAPGVGLAAPQVGRSVSLIVVDVRNHEEDKKEPYILFNPEVVDIRGSCNDEEGCLSFPELRVRVTRPEVVTVKALNKEGRPFTLEKIRGLLSRCIQHEIDHLDGILFIDKISKADKLLLSGKLKKMAKKKRTR